MVPKMTEFKYLGHVINSCMSDDDDINREVRSKFTRTNVLVDTSIRKLLCVCRAEFI